VYLGGAAGHLLWCTKVVYGENIKLFYPSFAGNAEDAKKRRIYL